MTNQPTRCPKCDQALTQVGNFRICPNHGQLSEAKPSAVLRICQLLSKGLYGRQWLFEEVEKWRQHTKLDSRLFWIMGAPGVGKSAFAAQLTDRARTLMLAYSQRKETLRPFES